MIGASFAINRRKVLSWMFFIQVLLLWGYLFSNIALGHDGGVASPLLVIFLLIGGSGFVFSGSAVSIKYHFFLVLAFVFWVLVRYSIDLNDDNYTLGQVVFGTSGGIALFYVVGALLSSGLWQKTSRSIVGFDLLLFLFFGGACFLFAYIIGGVREDVFLVAELDENYQRPGNFITISHVIVSYLYVCNHFSKGVFFGSKIACSLRLLSYSISTFLMITTAQLIGSNSATVVVLVVFVVTLFYVLTINRRVFDQYVQRGLVVFKIRHLISRVAKFIGLIVAVMVLIGLFFLVGQFNIPQIRIFNFGEAGELSSVGSRLALMQEYAIAQLSFAPILGHANVAYLVTKDAGSFLHSSVLSVLTSLGLLGLSIFLLSIFAIIFQLYRESIRRYSGDPLVNFRFNTISSCSLVFFLLVISFSAVATHFSWSVLWFSIGFLSHALSLKGLSCKDGCNKLLRQRHNQSHILNSGENSNC